MVKDFCSFMRNVWSSLRSYKLRGVNKYIIKSEASSSNYIKHKRQCFNGISKHRGESWKYDAQRSIFDEIPGVWIADEILSPVFDIHVSSQSKQKLRRKRRSKIVKVYAN